jgi:dihydroflavonol-4-reductase
MAKQCLVTGGLGFLGQHVVELLRSYGDEVRILDVATPQQEIPGVEYVTGSITDAGLVREAMEGRDYVFHLAANAGLWSPRKQDFLTVNQTGTRNIMEAAMDAGVERVVHTSTESVLKSDRSRENQVFDESVELTYQDMVGAYCKGKFLAEQEAREAAKRGLHVVIVNPSIPIGPGDRNLTPPSRMIVDFLNGKYPAYLESVLNVVDVRDVAYGHLLAIENGKPGERYFLGNQNIRLSELLQLLEQLTGIPMPERQIPYWLALVVSAVSETISDTITKKPPTAPLTGVRLARSPIYFDNTKATTELNVSFRPVMSSLKDAVKWYQQQGWLQPRGSGEMEK